MERRTFFGVLGLVGTFFGLQKSAAPNLPVIRFDEDGWISNHDEVFGNGYYFKAKTGHHVEEIVAKAWLPIEYGYRCLGGKIIYGPVLIQCSNFSKPNRPHYSIVACPESLQRGTPHFSYRILVYADEMELAEETNLTKSELYHPMTRGG